MGGAVLECPVQIHLQNSGFIALFDFPICSLRKSRIGLSDADDDVSRQSLSIGKSKIQKNSKIQKCRIRISDADDDISRQSLSIGQLGQPVPTHIAAQKSNFIWWLHKSDTRTSLHRPATLFIIILTFPTPNNPPHLRVLCLHRSCGALCVDRNSALLLWQVWTQLAFSQNEAQEEELIYKHIIPAWRVLLTLRLTPSDPKLLTCLYFPSSTPRH